jgi:hypothetical protein
MLTPLRWKKKRGKPGKCEELSVDHAFMFVTNLIFPLKDLLSVEVVPPQERSI